VNTSKDGECTAHPKTKKNKQSQNLLSGASSDQKNFNYLRLSCPLLSLLKIEAVVACK
jgi:hypothetical protein